MDGLTKTESCLAEALGDGQPHHPADLLPCLGDPQATLANLQWHISMMRKKLPAGLEIVCVISRRRMGYRLMRALEPAGPRG
jgi:hypothetical protein